LIYLLLYFISRCDWSSTLFELV